MPHPVSRGRRGGTADSRDEILNAAKQLFAEQGFEGTSLRQVARAAGVDPAMIHHFFNGKDELFALSVELPVEPGQVLLRRIWPYDGRIGSSVHILHASGTARR